MIKPENTFYWKKGEYN